MNILSLGEKDLNKWKEDSFKKLVHEPVDPGWAKYFSSNEKIFSVFKNADWLLGKFFIEGVVIPKDETIGLELFRRDIQKFDRNALFCLAYFCFNQRHLQNIPEALNILHQASEDGFQAANFLLGKIYLNPRIGLTDHEKAIFYLSRAKKKNKGAKSYSPMDYFGSKYLLGIAHFWGWGVTKDHILTRKLMTDCLDAKFPKAGFFLGLLEIGINPTSQYARNCFANVSAWNYTYGGSSEPEFFLALSDLAAGKPVKEVLDRISNATHHLCVNYLMNSDYCPNASSAYDGFGDDFLFPYKEKFPMSVGASYSLSSKRCIEFAVSRFLLFGKLKNNLPEAIREINEVIPAQEIKNIYTPIKIGLPDGIKRILEMIPPIPSNMKNVIKETDVKVFGSRLTKSERLQERKNFYAFLKDVPLDVREKFKEIFPNQKISSLENLLKRVLGKAIKTLFPASNVRDTFLVTPAQLFDIFNYYNPETIQDFYCSKYALFDLGSYPDILAVKAFIHKHGLFGLLDFQKHLDCLEGIQRLMIYEASEASSEWVGKGREKCLSLLSQKRMFYYTNAAAELATYATERRVSQEKDRTHKETLSFLTHTLRNTLSTGPESVRQSIRLLKGSSFYDLGGNEKKVINNIVSLLSVFSFTETLLDTFKQFSADPDFVKKSWKNDKTGESDISMTLAFALRQSLSRVLFLSNSRSALKKLLGSDDLSNLTQIRKSFVDNLIPLEITKGDDQKIYSWLSKNFSNIGISIGSGSELSFQTNNVRFTIFFATFSELIFNAIKYFDGQGEISISWEESESGFLFQCKNTFDDNAGQPNQLITPNSTNSGLYFVKRLMSQLEKSRFTIAFQNNLYVASLFFSKDNF